MNQCMLTCGFLYVRPRDPRDNSRPLDEKDDYRGRIVTSEVVMDEDRYGFNPDDSYDDHRLRHQPRHDREWEVIGCSTGFDPRRGRAKSPDSTLEVPQAIDQKLNCLVDWRAYELSNSSRWSSAEVGRYIRKFWKRVKHVMDKRKFDDSIPIVFLEFLIRFLQPTMKQKSPKKEHCALSHRFCSEPP